MTAFIIIDFYSVICVKCVLIRILLVLKRSNPKCYNIHEMCLVLSSVKIIFFLFLFLFFSSMVNDRHKQSRGNLFCQNGPEYKYLKSTVKSE